MTKLSDLHELHLIGDLYSRIAQHQSKMAVTDTLQDAAESVKEAVGLSDGGPKTRTSRIPPTHATTRLWKCH